MTIKKLTKRQAYQAKLLSKFNFIIFYTMSKDNIKINAFI